MEIGSVLCCAACLLLGNLDKKKDYLSDPPLFARIVRVNDEEKKNEDGEVKDKDKEEEGKKDTEERGVEGMKEEEEDAEHKSEGKQGETEKKEKKRPSGRLLMFSAKEAHADELPDGTRKKKTGCCSKCSLTYADVFSFLMLVSMFYPLMNTLLQSMTDMMAPGVMMWTSTIVRGQQFAYCVQDSHNRPIILSPTLEKLGVYGFSKSDYEDMELENRTVRYSAIHFLTPNEAMIYNGLFPKDAIVSDVTVSSSAAVESNKSTHLSFEYGVGQDCLSLVAGTSRLNGESTLVGVETAYLCPLNETGIAPSVARRLVLKNQSVVVGIRSMINTTVIMTVSTTSPFIDTTKLKAINASEDLSAFECVLIDLPLLSTATTHHNVIGVSDPESDMIPFQILEAAKPSSLALQEAVVAIGDTLVGVAVAYLVIRALMAYCKFDIGEYLAYEIKWRVLPKEGRRMESLEVEKDRNE